MDAVSRIDRLQTANKFLKRLFFSDEATFHMSGKVNRYNVCLNGDNKILVFTNFYGRLGSCMPGYREGNYLVRRILQQMIRHFLFCRKNIDGNIFMDILEVFGICARKHVFFMTVYVFTRIKVLDNKTKVFRQR